MKKYWPYILILLALGAAVGYFVYAYSPAALAKKESAFGVKDTDKIERIKLTNEKGESLTLSRQGKKWRLNDKYEANEVAVSNLLNTVHLLEAAYIAPTNAQPIVLKDLSKQRTKCEIYAAGEDKPFKAYYVGGPTADGTGTYMIMELDGKMAANAYVTHINGQKAYLTAVYAPIEERWRTRWVYQDNAATIESLKVEYHRERQKSFTINKVAKDSFVIANSESKVEEQPRQKFIQQYLDFYEGLSIEAYENNNVQKDTILMDQPFCTITLRRADKTETQSILYYAPINRKTMVKFDDNGRPLQYDIEHYYAQLNDKKDLVLIQYYVWGKVLRSYDEFFRRPAQAAK